MEYESLERGLGEVVEGEYWRPQWQGFMKGESASRWKPYAPDSLLMAFARQQATMVVACPKKDVRPWIHLQSEAPIVPIEIFDVPPAAEDFVEVPDD